MHAYYFVHVKCGTLIVELLQGAVLPETQLKRRELSGMECGVKHSVVV